MTNNKKQMPTVARCSQIIWNYYINRETNCPAARLTSRNNNPCFADLLARVNTAFSNPMKHIGILE
jgi:hypothetical protein